jgi:hypothetical protein
VIRPPLRARVGKLPQDRLVADHDDFVVVRNVGRNPDRMLELGARHAAPSRSLVSLQIRQRCRGGMMPAKGVDCRSSRACSPGSTGELGGFRSRPIVAAGAVWVE